MPRGGIRQQLESSDEDAGGPTGGARGITERAGGPTGGAHGGGPTGGAPTGSGASSSGAGRGIRQQLGLEGSGPREPARRGGVRQQLAEDTEESAPKRKRRKNEEGEEDVAEKPFTAHLRRKFAFGDRSALEVLEDAELASRQGAQSTTRIPRIKI